MQSLKKAILMPAKRVSPVTSNLSVPIEFIERRIFLIRGQKVMLDSDLAELYRVTTGNLNLAVRRNSGRFPEDFIFQVAQEEFDNLRLQFATSSSGYGGRRYLPYAFTELGVAMLSSVLKSERAVQMNIRIMRAFVKVRELLATHKDLARKIEDLAATQKDHAVMLVLVVKDIQALATTVKNEFQRLKEPRRRKARIGFKV
jgi:hypothetical protein